MTLSQLGRSNGNAVLCLGEVIEIKKIKTKYYEFGLCRTSHRKSLPKTCKRNKRQYRRSNRNAKKCKGEVIEIDYAFFKNKLWKNNIKIAHPRI